MSKWSIILHSLIILFASITNHTQASEVQDDFWNTFHISPSWSEELILSEFNLESPPEITFPGKQPEPEIPNTNTPPSKTLTQEEKEKVISHLYLTKNDGSKITRPFLKKEYLHKFLKKLKAAQPTTADILSKTLGIKQKEIHNFTSYLHNNVVKGWVQKDGYDYSLTPHGLYALEKLYEMTSEHTPEAKKTPTKKRASSTEESNFEEDCSSAQPQPSAEKKQKTIEKMPDAAPIHSTFDSLPDQLRKHMLGIVENEHLPALTENPEFPEAIYERFFSYLAQRLDPMFFNKFGMNHPNLQKYLSDNYHFTIIFAPHNNEQGL